MKAGFNSTLMLPLPLVQAVARISYLLTVISFACLIALFVLNLVYEQKVHYFTSRLVLRVRSGDLC